ncbi:MAG TPA: hypothetical protein VI876_05335 [Dehalococcoidia bacterium]|nr:hypothetical protein [Dehalococcoidia bacterium]
MRESSHSPPDWGTVKQGFLDCLSEAIPLVADRLKMEKPGVIQQRTYVRESDQRGSFPVVLRYDLSYFLMGIFRELEKLESVAKLREIVVEQGLASTVLVDASGKPFNAEGETNWLVNLWVEPLLLDYVGQDLVDHWDQGRAEAVLEPLLAFLRAETLSWRTVAPLYNTGGPDDFSFDFSAVLRLRPITQQERDSLWASGEFSGFIDRMTVTELKFCLEYAWSAPKAPSAGHSRDASLAISDLVTAFRLAGIEKIAAPVETTRTIERTYGLGYGDGGMRASFDAGRIFGQSELTAAVCEKARDVAASLPAASAKKTIRLALDRLNYAARRLRNEDKLLDSWIGLEALFLPDGRQGELRYRAALRMAFYLAEEPEARPAIFDEVKASYDSRPSLVHGDEVPGLRDTATLTFDLLRRALLKAINDPESIGSDRLHSMVLGA